MASTAHPLPDAWLGTRLQLAIRDLAVVNGYADSVSAPPAWPAGMRTPA